MVEMFRFRVYKYKPGPFCICFYDPGNKNNKNLYFYLKNVLKDFPDIPFLRFNYKIFKICIKDEKVTKSDQILILEKGKESRIEETDNHERIIEILKEIRQIHIKKRKALNLEFKRRNKLKAWAPHGHTKKYSDFLILDTIDAETMYKFPNTTADFKRKGNDFDTKQSKVILPKTLNVQQKFPINSITKPSFILPKTSQSLIMLPLQKVKTPPKKLKLIKEKPAHPAVLDFSKRFVINSLYSSVSDQPLDLSLPKIKKY